MINGIYFVFLKIFFFVSFLGNLCGKENGSSKNFKCRSCLANKNNLLLPAQKRQYSCTNCTKTFNHKANLKAHLRIHTKVKPYICKYCNQSFTFKLNLISHASACIENSS